MCMLRTSERNNSVSITMDFLHGTVRIKTTYLVVFAVCMTIWHVMYILSCDNLRSKVFSRDNGNVVPGSDHDVTRIIQKRTETVNNSADGEGYSLENLYVTRLSTDRLRYVPEIQMVRTTPCVGKSHAEYPCVDLNCTGQMKVVDQHNLNEFLDGQYRVPDVYQDAIRDMQRRTRHHTVLLVTAVSNSQFMDSLLFLKNVHEVLYPAMADYDFHFVLYDLDLTSEQRAQMEDLCECEVRDFPSETLPGHSQLHECYAWRPVIISANLPMAEVLLMADVSVRFKTTNMAPLLRQIKTNGVTLTKIHRPMAPHLPAQMLDYYGDRLCRYSHFWDIDNSFIGLYNDKFVREAIVAPWLSCAFDPDCMCSQDVIRCFAHGKQYDNCYRPDQASLNIILIKLFQKHIKKLTVPLKFSMI